MFMQILVASIKCTLSWLVNTRLTADAELSLYLKKHAPLSLNKDKLHYKRSNHKSRSSNSQFCEMSSLKYINDEGAGQKHSDLAHYSQVVVIGNIAKLSGQGGWDKTGELDQYDWKQQIDNAFDNIDRVLQAAGFRGWEDVCFLSPDVFKLLLIHYRFTCSGVISWTSMLTGNTS